MTTKKTFFIEPDLIKDSSDFFRNLFGGNFSQEPALEGEVLLFEDAELENPSDNRISEIFFEQEQTTVNYENLVPNYTVPVRIASSQENFESDQEWAAYIE